MAGEPAHWGVTDYLLAHIADGINNLTYCYVSANSKSPPRQPEPIPRPEARSVSNKPKPMSKSNEVAKFFGASAVSVQGR